MPRLIGACPNMRLAVAETGEGSAVFLRCKGCGCRQRQFRHWQRLRRGDNGFLRLRRGLSRRGRGRRCRVFQPLGLLIKGNGRAAWRRQSARADKRLCFQRLYRRRGVCRRVIFQDLPADKIFIWPSGFRCCRCRQAGKAKAAAKQQPKREPAPEKR